LALAPDKGNDTFLSGPLELRPGVTLLVPERVVLFGSRNPRVYDVRPGSCGVVNDDGRGCKPLIHADHALHGAVMGLGAIDGQGGERLLHQDVSWWDLAQQAKVQNTKQNCFRLLVVDSSDDFTLYGITFRNSPNFHVIVNKTDGFTAWGVKIDSPATARNTDGIDPSSSTNVTITHSYIRAGDDNIAIKAGKTGPATQMTITHNHFYSGHGMSIGSETSGDASAIRVSDLSIDGADNGLRIKSDLSRGGLVHEVEYQDVCIRNVKHPILMDPFYSNSPGTLVPLFEDIRLKNVRDENSGRVTLLGHDAQHLLRISMDGVWIEGLRPAEIRAAHARIAIGPGKVNFMPSGEDVAITGEANGWVPSDCKNAFVPFPDGPVVKPQSLPQVAAPIELPPPKNGNRTEAVVAPDGSGDFRSVQEAVDSLVAAGGTVRIKPGIYREVVRIAKPRVRRIGLSDDPSKIVIVNGNSAYSSGSTFKSATVFISGDDFYGSNLTFQNDYSKTQQPQQQGSQALALSVNGDRAVFRNMRFLGAQDTLYAAGRSCQSETGPCVPARQYFENCYIEGHVDFIFGNALAVFDHCEVHAIAHRVVYLTAQSKHYPDEQSGYLFDHCKITADLGVGIVFLGRPWRSYSNVVFLNSELDAKVDPAGWSEWQAGQTERLRTAFYGEFNSSGAGANPKQREPYSHQLTGQVAAQFSPERYLAGSDGWNPRTVK
jgi:polygalacturonase